MALKLKINDMNAQQLKQISATATPSSRAIREATRFVSAVAGESHLPINGIAELLDRVGRTSLNESYKINQMNRNELLKQAMNGGNLFELIEDYQHSANPHKLHRESEAYQAFRAGQFKRLVYWLLVQIRAQNTPKYEVIEQGN